ncbi:hypothetical protein CYMTET_18713 [Cymbomonas tetramitiformis]|uniref:Uncharacterized protein n=1 Tax=Cymbomonas tetramitiformis TaxID=36881 RepID=A0AAE0G7K4_9CHLO|nr:hypothetical protein CYMTET_18713 [Cymbomonas tetramitiformis]
MSWLSCCVALSTVLLFITADGALEGYGDNTYVTLTWDTVVDDQYCEPYSWKDYELVVDEEHSHYNIIFEVFDRNQAVEGYKIDGLSIWLFEDTIPTDRESAFYQKFSIDGILSFAVNSYDAKQKTYWLGVQCSHERSEFQVLATYVKSELSNDGHSTHGIVCPGEWIYHHFIPADRLHPQLVAALRKASRGD